MTWNRTYGGAEDEVPHPVLQTPDGGYLVAGYTWSFSSDEYYDAWLVKTDRLGTVLWSRTFGGPAGD